MSIEDIISTINIKPYYKDEGVAQYCNDALEVLLALPANSIDLLATDPPYGIFFMGKDWDRALPDKRIWAECLRVLKPGAFAFVMSIPRADCLSRMIISLEDAGFMVNFTPIFWAYASGFPKAQNIGKAVDKRIPRQELFIPFAKHYAKQRKAKSLTHNEICEVGKFYDQHNHGGASSNWERGVNVPTLKQWRILQPLLRLSLQFLPLIEREEAEREVIGRHPTIKGHGSVFNMEFEGYPMITAPATPQAKALDGSYGGFQPKPAVEVIIVCMKPLSEKTFVDQALKNQKGISWLDDCRIPYESEGDKETVKTAKRFVTDRTAYGIYEDDDKDITNYRFNPTGRFPANLLVSDDVLNDGRVTKSGKAEIGMGHDKETITYGHFAERKITSNYQDSGSFSRYFDLDKWAQKTFPFLIVPKASKSEKNRGCEDLPIKPCEPYQFNDDPTFRNVQGRSGDNKTHNYHPTVKPLKLMSYLITLGSRPSDVVLDPFSGSGTTALACQLLSRKNISIEIAEKYCEIAVKRLSQSVMGLNI